MHIINFAHPLTAEQRDSISTAVGSELVVHQISVQIDRSITIAEHAVAVVDAVGLSGDEWQTLPLAVIPPGLAALACTVQAELHGRAGYFVPVVVLRPVAHAVPPRFEFHEIIDVQRQRDEARKRRFA